MGLNLKVVWHALTKGVESAQEKFKLSDNDTKKLDEALAEAMSGEAGKQLKAYDEATFTTAAPKGSLMATPAFGGVAIGVLLKLLVAVGALLGIQSCGEKDDPIPVPTPPPTNITIIQYEDFDLNVTIINKGIDAAAFAAILEPFVNRIITAIENANNKDNSEDLKSILNALKEQTGSLTVIKMLLEELGADNQTVIDLLKNLGLDADDIKALLGEVNNNLNDIKATCEKELKLANNNLGLVIENMKNHSYALADIISVLTNLGYQLNQIIDGMAKQGKSLSDIYNELVANNIDNKAILQAIKGLVGVNSDVAIKLDTIINNQNKGYELDKETQDIVFKVLQAVYDLRLGGGNVTFDTQNIEKALAAILDAIGKTTAAVKDMGTQNKELLTYIADLVETFMAQEKAMDEKSMSMITNLTAIVTNFASQEDQNDEEVKAILKELTELLRAFKDQEKKADGEAMDAINMVFEAIKNIKLIGNTGDVKVDLSKVESTLAGILASINSLPTKDNMIQMKDEVIKAINTQTALINTFMNQAADMDKATQEKMVTFINNFAEFVKQEGENDDKLYDLVSKMAATLNSFMENEAKMDAKEVELAQKILDKINNLKLEAGDVTVEVDMSKLEAMMQVLVDKAGDLDAKLEEIVKAVVDGNENLANLVKQFMAQNNADIGDLKALLTAIKVGVDKNGEALLDNNQKLDVIISTLNKLKDLIPDENKKVLDKLDEILNKIPAGCDCNADGIIAKLEIIITELQKNPSNEGIVDDLDDLLK